MYSLSKVCSACGVAGVRGGAVQCGAWRHVDRIFVLIIKHETGCCSGRRLGRKKKKKRKEGSSEGFQPNLILIWLFLLCWLLLLSARSLPLSDLYAPMQHQPVSPCLIFIHFCIPWIFSSNALLYKAHQLSPVLTLVFLPHVKHPFWTCDALTISILSFFSKLKWKDSFLS